jgi:hypothetical protein
MRGFSQITFDIDGKAVLLGGSSFFDLFPQCFLRVCVMRASFKQTEQ